MSVRCQGWVYENSEARGNDRLVLLAIADEADDDGTNAYPGIERIAHKARVPKRTTMRCIERLEEAGELLVERPDVRGRGRYNTYIVLMGRNGATLSPISGESEKARNGATKARKGAQPYLIGDRPIDPLTQNPEVKGSPPRPDDGFDDFWRLFPNNNAKKADARKAWPKALRKVGGDPAVILDAAARFAADPNLPEKQFIPHASTWLNGERWNDGPLPPRVGRRVVASDAPRLSKSRQNSDRYYERLMASERERSEGDDRLGIGQLAAGDHRGSNGSLVRRVGEA